MKKQRIIRFLLVTAIAGLFMFQPVFASTPAQDCATALWRKFQGQIKYPEFAHQQALQGEVTILFTLAEDGDVVVKDIIATDTDLGNYIRQVVSTVKCPELQNAAGVNDFKVKFHFRLI
jgi:hypothetical protein